MRKNKTWEITLTDNTRLVANEPIENAVVYTTDTEAYLNFRVIDSGFEFDSATIAMLNKDDGSIVERTMTKEDDTAVYEIESDIIPHFGLWQTQVLFKQGEEIFTSTPVTFVIERYMMAEQPPRLEDVINWKDLYENATETINDLTRINDELTTTNEAVQQAEAQRVSAENERSTKYESYAQQFNDVITDLSEKKDYHSLPEISAARGGHDTLGARLDETTTQLAQKVGGGKLATLNDLDEETINFIHDGTGGPIEINSVPKEGSVRPSSTNFAKLGKNKFEGDYLRNVALLGPTTENELVFNTTADSVVAVARIEPGEHWAVSKQGGNRFRVALSDEYPKPGDRLTNYKYNEGNVNSTTIYSETEKYLLVHVSNNNEFPLIQVEKGQAVTPYEEPYVVFNHGQGSIESTAVADNLPIGVLTGAEGSFRVDFREEKIITYSQGSYVTAGNETYNLTDAEYPFSTVSTQGINIVLNPATGELELLSVLNLHGRLNKILIGYIRKDQQSAFIFGNHTVINESENNNEPIGNDKLIKLFGDDGSHYNAVDTTPIHKNLADYYQQWDDLMAVADAEKSVLTTTTNNNEVICYEFGLPSVNQLQRQSDVVDYVRPKIVVFSGIHGQEKESIFSTLSFFKDLIENTESQKALDFIKMNAKFVVVPLLNPDGFEAGTRKNGNNVDLNRNFPHGWQSSSDPESTYYSGPSAASELETQAAIQLLQDHKDALMVFDIHNYNGITWNDDALWIGVSNPNVQRIYYGFGYTYSEILKEDVPVLQQFDNNIFTIRNPVRTGGLSGQFIYEGLNGMILELATASGHVGILESQRMNSHITGNMILAALRSYEDLLG